MDRRQVLQGLGLSAVSVALAACGEGSTGSVGNAGTDKVA
jgi:hypothetical protein